MDLGGGGLFSKLSGRQPRILDQDDYKCFAVIAPVLAGTDSLLFEVRADSLSKQPGEICFPGGFIEDGETPLEAGVRELAEELLVSPGDIEIVAPLDILLTHYGLMIYPFLGYLSGYGRTFSPDEVKEVFTVPVKYFLDNDPATYINKTLIKTSDNFPHELVGGDNYHWRSGKMPVLFYQYHDKVIWGLTARIVKNIVDLIR